MRSISAGHSDARALRERPLFRLLALAAVLTAAFLATKGCASSGTKYSAKDAIAIARKQLDFTPKCVQIRYLRSGFKSEPIWAVALWTLDKAGRFDRLTNVIVAARTGKVISVRKQPPTNSTPAQCRAPV
jgi:hypothetical protein